MAGESLTGQIVEIWFLYIIGAFMIGARIFCRTKLIGWRNYEWDDYLIVVIAVSFAPRYHPPTSSKSARREERGHQLRYALRDAS